MKERLWAPWRISYIKNTKQKGCIFCKARKSAAKNYVIINSRHSICLLNIFPYNNGHVMVSPKRHVRDLSLLRDKEILDLFRCVTKARRMLDKILKPDGYNIGINLSRCAGAGITGHLHIHLVPRWVGDTNFMPVTFNTKVISQSLCELYGLLKNAGSKTD